MSAIDVKNLVKKFHGQTVLHGIDLEVQEGEVVAIIGPSGSGKTTLLRSINLLEHPEGGTIRVGEITIDTGKSLSQQKGLIRRLRQHVGFVFQSFNLFPIARCWKTLLKGRSLSKASRRMKPPPAPVNCWRKWGFPAKRAAIRAVFPVGSSSVWPLPARWLCALT